MLDYDMLASANYVRFVYDGDGSSPGNEPFKGPPGSGLIEEVQKSYFTSKGLQTAPTPFDGRSDYVGFTDEGIPAGGIFAGAEGIKTPEQEAVYGGDAGSWYDPCYHQMCDDFLTVLTGMPPIRPVEEGGAEGLRFLDETPTAEERQEASRKMKGGALRGLNEMSDAASYTVWYFSSTKNPWGDAKAQSSRAKKGKRYRKSRKLKRVERWGYGRG
jgi:Peptidase family M28